LNKKAFKAGGFPAFLLAEIKFQKMRKYVRYDKILITI